MLLSFNIGCALDLTNENGVATSQDSTTVTGASDLTTVGYTSESLLPFPLEGTNICCWSTISEKIEVALSLLVLFPSCA